MNGPKTPAHPRLFLNPEILLSTSHRPPHPLGTLYASDLCMVSELAPLSSIVSKRKEVKNLVIIVRADPIICGHSTEARNLAEAALKLGIETVHIVSYPLETLQSSGLPLKPLETVSPYSEGIVVDRPEPIGDYKVLDGRLSYSISGRIVDLLHKLPGHTVVMDLYLVPHGQMVINAVESFKQIRNEADVTTIGEAVGSDITNVVNNALTNGQLGAAQMVLSNYLAHDVPVAVSQYTIDQIVEAGEKVDNELGTNFAQLLSERVQISFPAIDTAAYTSIETQPELIESTLRGRNLDQDGFVMFLSRIAPAKGVDDLIAAYRSSKIYGRKKLVICGNGPMKEEIIEMSKSDPHICVLDDVSDEEKGILMHACLCYCLPSKPKIEFVETFGIAIAEKMLAGGLGPVITTRTGGIPEATGGNCLEHDAGNIDQLRQCLDKAHFISDDQRRALSDSARDFALQFDRENTLKKLLAKADVMTPCI